MSSAHAVVHISDCQDEQPLAPVARAGLARAEYSDRNAAAQSLQCRDGNGELSCAIPDDVLAEEHRSPALIEHLDRAVEQPAVVVLPKPLPGDAVALAGISRQDAIHCAAPRSSVEGSQVRPDSSRMKPPCFHRRDKACGCTDFPLHETNAATSGFGNSDAEVEPSDAGAQTDGTKSHVTAPPRKTGAGGRETNLERERGANRLRSMRSACAQQQRECAV